MSTFRRGAFMKSIFSSFIILGLTIVCSPAFGDQERRQERQNNRVERREFRRENRQDRREMRQENRKERQEMNKENRKDRRKNRKINRGGQ